MKCRMINSGAAILWTAATKDSPRSVLARLRNQLILGDWKVASHALRPPATSQKLISKHAAIAHSSGVLKRGGSCGHLRVEVSRSLNYWW